MRNNSASTSDIVDFVVIGAMKSGTTSFFTSYRTDPYIGFTAGKEAKFFNQPITEEGLATYVRKFEHLQNGQQRGDVTPEYSMRHLYPHTARRIKEHAPNCKIIYLVRDPISRTRSHVHHDLLRHRLKNSDVEKVLGDTNSTYVQTSMYAYQLEPYIELFGRQNILVVQFEELVKNTDEALRRVAAFLGVPHEGPDRLNKDNSSSSRYLIPYYDVVHRSIRDTRLTKAYHIFWSLVNIKIEAPDIVPYTEQLKEVLDEDVRRLYALAPHITFKHFS